MIERRYCAIPLMLACILGGCGAVGPSNHSSNPAENLIPTTSAVYVARDNLFVLAVIRGNIYTGRLAAGNRYERIPDILPPSGRLIDRSEAGVRCIAAGHITFAVPVSPHLGQQYECNGLRFSVDRCGGAADCETYDIAATCWSFRDERCYLQPGRGNTPAMVYRLRGARQTGIVGINFAPESSEYELSLREGAGVFADRE